MCKSFFTIVLVCSVTFAARAQPADEEVRAVVDQLFDGMRKGDSTAVRAVLHPEARFLTTLVREGRPALHVGSVARFLEAVGTPHEEEWDERIRDVAINVDDRLATAWMDYSFYLGDRFSHCGVNAVQFFRGESGWKIIQITDTRRTEGCERPADD